MSELTDRDKALLGPTDPATQRGVRNGEPDLTATRALVVEAARLLHNRHCEEVIAFDVSQLSQLTDYILIGSGTSDRQMRSIEDEMIALFGTHGLQTYGSERDPNTTWFVLDFVDVMIHLFEPNTRAHYDLEMLWGDAPKVHWQQ